MIVCAASFVFAYNPPSGGEQMEKITGAVALGSASSVAGGGLFFAEPHSILYNPALIAFEQRAALNAGFTYLHSMEQKKGGAAFQTGILYPWKYFVGAADVRGNFSSFEKMNTANSINATIAASKELTESISVGVSLGAGGLWGASGDWQLGLGLGALYKIPYFAFMKDIRFGASVLNLGKNYNKTTLAGIDAGKNVGMFPGVATLRTGAAAIFVEQGPFELGLSFDMTFPSFQNLLVDIGVQMSFDKKAYISISESFNVRELTKGYYDLLPAVTFGWRFVLDTRKNQYMVRNGWQESEMRIDGGWKYLYQDIHAVSGNVSLKLGLKDTEPPVVELWGGKR